MKQYYFLRKSGCFCFVSSMPFAIHHPLEVPMRLVPFYASEISPIKYPITGMLFLSSIISSFMQIDVPLTSQILFLINFNSVSMILIIILLFIVSNFLVIIIVIFVFIYLFFVKLLFFKIVFFFCFFYFSYFPLNILCPYQSATLFSINNVLYLTNIFLFD